MPTHGHPSPSRTTGTSTPIAPQLLTALYAPKHETDGLGGWFRNVLDKPKFAIFEARVVIEELGNVPQFEGSFEVVWKFRGRRPHGREAAKLMAKPSLPNMKLNQSPTTITKVSALDTGSSTSLQSSNSSAASSLHNIPAATPPGSAPSSPQTANRGTGPTPLRQSTRAGSYSGSGQLGGIPQTDSPDLMAPAEISAYDYAAGMRQSSGSGAKNPYPLSIDMHVNVTPPQSGRNVSTTSTNSAGSVTVPPPLPLPRSVPNLPPPMRSGTAPSAAVLLDPLPGRDNIPSLPPPSITRSGSAASLRSTESLFTAKPTSRSRILSGPAGFKSDSDANGHRKGTTPSKPLSGHGCEWHYTIHHTLKIPFGKNVAASGASAGKRNKAPILGHGALSESGLSLLIYRSKTHSTSSTTRPPDEDDTARARYTDKDQPECNAGEGKEKKERGEKMLYGEIDIDLAPFAWKGKVARNFLLKGSKTNAIVRLTIDLRQVGGDAHWAAPLMQEGHHVTGVPDLIGGGDGTRSPPGDLDLERNSSNSSSNTSTSGNNTAKSRSATSLQLPPSCSAASLAPAKPEYKSYEHHLKPTDIRGFSKYGMASVRPRHDETTTPKTPPDSPSVPLSGSGPSTAQPNTSDATPRSKGDEFLGTFQRKKSIHQHHSIHIRHDGRRSYAAQHGHRGVNELSPETVIELIFNPRPAAEEGPMTYVPAPTGPGGLGVPSQLQLQHEAEVLQSVGEGQAGRSGEESSDGAQNKEQRGTTVWKRIRQRAQSRAHS